MTIELAIQPTACGLSSLELARSEKRAEHVDAIVVDHPGGALTNFDIAAAILRNTPSKVVLTHWAGVMEPQEAAGQIASLSRRSNGRLALRISLGGLGLGSEASQSAWEQADEYLRLLKRAWTNETPFDHEGPFYNLRGCYTPEKPLDLSAIPIWIDGVSQAALTTIGRHADVVEFRSADPEEIGFLVNRINAAAREVGRPDRVRFAFSGKPARIVTSGEAGQDEDLLARYVEAGVSTFILRGDVAVASLTAVRRGIEQASIVTPPIPAEFCGHQDWHVGGQF